MYATRSMSALDGCQPERMELPDRLTLAIDQALRASPCVTATAVNAEGGEWMAIFRRSSGVCELSVGKRGKPAFETRYWPNLLALCRAERALLPAPGRWRALSV